MCVLYNIEMLYNTKYQIFIIIIINYYYQTLIIIVLYVIVKYLLLYKTIVTLT